MAQEDRAPWYGELENIPYCFVIRGEGVIFPDTACNSEGVPLITPIYVLSPVEDPKKFKPVHALKLGRDYYTCLICGVKQKGNNQTSNNSNAFTHIRSAHIEEYPINCWTKEEASRRQKTWEGKLAVAKRPTQRVIPQQITLQQSFASRAIKVSEQIQAWTVAVIIGNLVLSLERNQGTRSLISFYNGGRIPRGLSYRGIVRNMETQYTEIICEAKKQLRVSEMNAISRVYYRMISVYRSYCINLLRV